MVKIMTDKKRNVPKLRFRGFTETWEQRKLGEVSTIVGGGTPSTKNSAYWGGTINWYSPAEIDDQIYVNNSQRKITELGLSKSSASLLPIGTVLFTSRAGIGKTAILGKKACTNQGFQSIIPNKKELDSYFVYTMTAQLKRYGETHGAGSTFVEVSGKQMAKMPVVLPKYEEQIQISFTFKQLDSLVALHQRKQNQLKKVKKALLQKMFADEKNPFPFIRFKGFTEAWEQRKLGDLGSLKNGMNFSKDRMGIGFPFVNLQDVFGKSIVTKQHLDKAQATDSQLRTYNLFKGDVLFVRSSVKLEGVGQAVVVPSDFINTTYSGFLIRFRDQTNLDNKFKSQIFKTRNIRTQIMSKATDSANKNINQSSLAKLKIVFPSKTEQEKIGKLLEDLDKVITLHQRKLDQLQKLKKSLLQNMFI